MIIKNFFLILLISLQLIYLIDCQNERPCYGISDKYKSFRSYLNFVYHKQHIRFHYEPRNFIIRETFHRNKGKLELENHEHKKETFIFDFDIQQMYIINFEKKICVTKNMTNTNRESSDIGFDFIRDENVIGITSILNTLIGRDGIRSENITEYRGIEVDNCIFTNQTEPKFEVILAKKFDTITEPILAVKMVKNVFQLAPEAYSGEYFYLKRLDDDKELEEQIELDLEDEENEIVLDQNFWHIPEFCKEKKQKKFDEIKELNLPDQYEFTFHRLIENETKISNLMIDHKHKLIRLSRFDSNDELIFDITNHIQYELNKTTCLKKFNDKYDNYEPYVDLIEILNKLKYIRSTDYIGRRSCRDDLLICDVFTFRSSIGDDLPENIFKAVSDDEDRRGRFFDTTIYTMSFYYDEQSKFHQLLQVKEQISYQDGKSNLIKTTVYDVFDFKNLNDNYRKAIDLIDCTYEEEHKISIQMTGLITKESNVDEIEQRSIERKTIDKIVEITNLTYYNIPRVETQINYDSLTMSLTLIQPINDLIHFETFERYKIPSEHLKEHYNKRTLEECAFLAKKNEWIGFQYCQQDLTCYSVMNPELFYLNPKSDTRMENCLTKKKISNLDYIEISNAIKQIESKLVNEDFKPDDGFSFQSLDNEYEMNQKEKENHFNLIKDERCFNLKKLNEKVECKQKPRLTDCILTCQSTNCAMLSVNKLEEDRFECCFVQQTYNDWKKQYESKDKLDNLFIENKTCSIYELTHLTMFNKLLYKKVHGEPLKSLIVKSAEDCAIECSQFNKQNTDLHCLSFDHCFVDSGDYHCKLRSYNQNSLENQNKLIDSTQCTFYSVNSLVDYHKTEFRQLHNFTVLNNYNLQDCAQECRKNRIQCSKFNFCKDKENLACLLETNQTMSKDHQQSAICTSYSTNEKLILDDVKNEITKESKKPASNKSGYVFFAIFLGVGLKIGMSIIFVQRVIQKKRKSKAYYVKFSHEEDAISIVSSKTENENTKINRNQNCKQASNQWPSIKQSLTQNLDSFVKENQLNKPKDDTDQIELEKSNEEIDINQLNESL